MTETLALKSELLGSASRRATAYDYDLAVFIGRFQPFHNGHLQVLRAALKRAWTVVMLVGSANRARDTRNTWTYEERARLIQQTIDQLAVEIAAERAQAVGRAFGDDVEVTLELRRRIIVQPLNDTAYDNQAWIAQVHHAAKDAIPSIRPRTCLIGNVRDATSEYLGWFPKWDYVAVEDKTGFQATHIRKALFSGADFSKSNWSDDGVDWDAVLPEPTRAFLQTFRQTPTYAYLVKQQTTETAYRERWGAGPFLTADPVIIQGGYVAMVERGGIEGEGMIALPGGFHNAGETARWAAAREAVEETAIFIPIDKLAHFKMWLGACNQATAAKAPAPSMPDYVEAAIRKLLSYQRGRGERFDDPHRSRRAHLITEAFLFVLPDGNGLPHLVGCDDARRAFWNPISEVSPLATFEDHAWIIDKMISLHF